jgi:DNA polymerase-3 subunit gamma/tau
VAEGLRAPPAEGDALGTDEAARAGAPPARRDGASPEQDGAPLPALSANVLGADAPDPDPRGRTSVAVAAQVEDQPAVAATTTLPGTPPAGGAQAGDVADRAAEQVSAALATEADPEPAVAAVAVVEPDAPAPAAPRVSAGVDLDLEAFAGVWPAVLESVRTDSPMLAALLADARPAALSGGELTLAWSESAAFLKRKAEAPTNRDLIARSIRTVTGASLRLACELRADGELPAAEAPTLSEDELIARVLAEFDAEELPPQPEPPEEP